MQKPTMSERLARWSSRVEAGSTIYNIIQGSGLVASFGLPAWAVHSSKLFSDYAPLSWVAAGFVGVALLVVLRLLWHVGNKIKIKVKFDAMSLERGSLINPLESTFVKERIHVNDFVLPSHPFIDGKAFIDCEIIGPANIYFELGNAATDIKGPKFDGVWLGPRAKFNPNNGFIFRNCTFKNCSFQRITMFASLENHAAWNSLPNVNWIGIEATPEDISARLTSLHPPVAT